MVPPLILPEIDVPHYWMNKSASGNARIPTEFMRAKLQQLMIDSTYLGHSNGCKPGRSMRGLQVTRCLRVENMKLWRAYCFCRESLREAADHGYSPLAQRPEPAKFFTKQKDRVIDASLNEFYLWHGTKPEIVDILAQHGFDERVASKSLCTATSLLGMALLMSRLSQIWTAYMALGTTSQMQRASRISTPTATVINTLTAMGSMPCCIVVYLWARLSWPLKSIMTRDDPRKTPAHPGSRSTLSLQRKALETTAHRSTTSMWCFVASSATQSSLCGTKHHNLMACPNTNLRPTVVPRSLTL